MRLILISVFIIASVSFLLAGGLIFPNLFASIGSFDNSPSDSLALAQLSLEIASLAALVFAAWEFMQSRHKPDLRIWIQPKEGDREVGSPTKLSTVNWEHSGFVQEENGKFYAFRFKVLLGNQGKATGRYVKVSMEVGSRTGKKPEDPVKTELERESENPSAGKWVPSVRPQHSDNHVYHGGADFIAYACSEENSKNKYFLDDLGQFVIRVPVFNDDKTNVKQCVKFHLYADGMKMKTEEIIFQLRE